MLRALPWNNKLFSVFKLASVHVAFMLLLTRLAFNFRFLYLSVPSKVHVAFIVLLRAFALKINILSSSQLSLIPFPTLNQVWPVENNDHKLVTLNRVNEKPTLQARC